MILPFSTQLNGKPTYFPEKIVTGLEHNKIISFDEAEHLFDVKIIHHKSKKGVITNTRIKLDGTIDHNPKLHTLRDDIKDRWRAEIMIDFFINSRTKSMFRFAPKLPVVSTQEVLMTYYHSDIIQISIDGRELFGYIERLEFAINDGFDNWEDFFNYFYPKIKAAPKEVYKPKLIHWTDLRY
jgi:hypothetical protein